MAQRNNITTNANHSAAVMPVLIGAAIALALMAFFVYSVNDPNPEWGEYWKLRPLAVATFAGAVGGAVFYGLNFFRRLLGWNHTLVLFASVLIYIIGLWMGFVLGLVGTLWN